MFTTNQWSLTIINQPTSQILKPSFRKTAPRIPSVFLPWGADRKPTRNETVLSSPKICNTISKGSDHSTNPSGVSGGKPSENCHLNGKKWWFWGNPFFGHRKLWFWTRDHRQSLADGCIFHSVSICVDVCYVHRSAMDRAPVFFFRNPFWEATELWNSMEFYGDINPLGFL